MATGTVAERGRATAAGPGPNDAKGSIVSPKAGVASAPVARRRRACQPSRTTAAGSGDEQERDELERDGVGVGAGGEQPEADQHLIPTCSATTPALRLWTSTWPKPAVFIIALSSACVGVHADRLGEVAVARRRRRRPIGRAAAAP